MTTRCNIVALLRALGTVVTGITTVLIATAEAGRNNATGCRRPHGERLVPRFLNGHYVTWPVRPCAGRPVGGTSHCDVNTPPPHVSYEPGNVIFTRMQMAGDRAFIVSPRYKYVIGCLLFGFRGHYVCFSILEKRREFRVLTVIITYPKIIGRGRGFRVPAVKNRIPWITERENSEHRICGF